MREILFRGKRTDNKQWVEGYLVLEDSKENPNPYIVNRRGKYRVAHSTVGQYTGLTDKNGKKIFEGDVVRITERGMTSDGAVVIFENGYPGGWLISDKTLKRACSLAMRLDVEIIGTIHDNQELLKGGEG